MTFLLLTNKAWFEFVIGAKTNQPTVNFRLVI